MISLFVLKSLNYFYVWIGGCVQKFEYGIGIISSWASYPYAIQVNYDEAPATDEWRASAKWQEIKNELDKSPNRLLYATVGYCWSHPLLKQTRL